MTNLQNPNPPIPVDAIEIDAAVLDLQLKLETNLTWLTHDYARAYRHIDNDNGNLLYFPEIYLGQADGIPKYHRVSPDNDKKGMCFFVVGKEENNQFQENTHNYLDYDLGIVFWVNLKLIDSTKLDTEIFTQNLIAEVREILTRKLLPAFYKLSIVEVCREFDDIYREFSAIKEDKNYLMAPFSAFRFNCRIKLQEDCPVAFDRCAAIGQNISPDERLNCVLPNIDFALPESIAALTPQQQTDLIAALCP